MKMKICKKCNLQYEDKFDYCRKCGNKLSSIEPLNLPKTQDQEKDIPKGTNKNFKIIGFIAAIVLLAVFVYNFSSTKNTTVPPVESDGSISLAFAKSDDKWGMVDKQGNWFIKPKYLSLYPFSEGLAKALDPETKKWGYIDKSGAWVIKPQFYISQENLNKIGSMPKGGDRAFYNYQPINLWGGRTNECNFSEGFACVDIDNDNKAYIDTKGKIICSGFKEGKRFKNGYTVIVVKTDGKKWGNGWIRAVIDKSGNYAIKPRKGGIEDFNDGYFSVSTDNGHGYMKPYDTDITSPLYDYAGNFSEGLAFVRLEDGTPCIIDKNFKVTINLTRIKEIRETIKEYQGQISILPGEGLDDLIDKQSGIDNSVYNKGKLKISLGTGLLGLETVKKLVIDKSGNVLSVINIKGSDFLSTVTLAFFSL